jgi:hypothetical protein
MNNYFIVFIDSYGMKDVCFALLSIDEVPELLAHPKVLMVIHRDFLEECMRTQGYKYEEIAKLISE